MPPNQDQNNDQPLSPTQPTQSPASMVPSTPLPGEPAFSNSSGSVKLSDGNKRTKWTLVVLAVLIVLGVGGYFLQRSMGADKKFNNLALAIKNQELNGAKNYVAASAIVNDISNSTSLGSTSVDLDKLQQTTSQEITSFQTIINKSCTDKSSDITTATIDSRMKDLKLSATQKQYVADMKKVIGSLESTDFSNTGICHDGPALVAYAKNLVEFLPGLEFLSAGIASPTDSQMATLKSYTTATIENESDLKAMLPNADQFLLDLKEILSDFYYEYTALNDNDTANLESYADKIQSLSDKATTDTDKMTAEINALDKKGNDAAVAASKAEIAAIDYQTNHKTSNSNMQLDYALPAFRIADAALSAYNDQHSGYPSGSSISDIASLDDNMKFLKDGNHLTGLSYSSLGSDQSGYSLSAKLADGTTLTEKFDPTSQST